MTAADACARFRQLHDSGCFVIPNPWDRGTAIALAGLGFRALATTSAGFAFSQGLPDSPTALTADAALGHISEIVESVDLRSMPIFRRGTVTTWISRPTTSPGASARESRVYPSKMRWVTATIPYCRWPTRPSAFGLPGRPSTRPAAM